MKRMIKWLEAKLFRSKSVYPPVNPARTKPDRGELDLPKDMLDLVNDTPPSDNGEYELEVTMGDITVPNLKLDDQFLSDTDISTGVDPYDTAKLHKK